MTHIQTLRKTPLDQPSRANAMQNPPGANDHAGNSPTRAIVNMIPFGFPNTDTPFTCRKNNTIRTWKGDSRRSERTPVDMQMK